MLYGEFRFWTDLEKAVIKSKLDSDAILRLQRLVASEGEQGAMASLQLLMTDFKDPKCGTGPTLDCRPWERCKTSPGGGAPGGQTGNSPCWKKFVEWACSTTGRFWLAAGRKLMEIANGLNLTPALKVIVGAIAQAIKVIEAACDTGKTPSDSELLGVCAVVKRLQGTIPASDILETVVISNLKSWLGDSEASTMLTECCASSPASGDLPPWAQDI